MHNSRISLYFSLSEGSGISWAYSLPSAETLLVFGPVHLTTMAGDVTGCIHST